MHRNRVRYYVLLIFAVLFVLWNDGLGIRYLSFVTDNGLLLNKIIVIFFLLVGCGLLVFLKNLKVLNNIYIKILIVLTCIIVLPVVCSNILLYRQPLAAVITKPFMFGGYLILPFLLLLHLTRKETVRLFYLMITITFIGCLIMVIAYFSIDFQQLLLDYVVSHRVGSFRIGGGRILPNDTLLLFYLILSGLVFIRNRQKKTALFCLFAVFIWVFLYVWQTRQVIFLISVTLLIILIFYRGARKQMLSVVLTCMLLFICLLVLSAGDVLSDGTFFGRLRALYDLTIHEYSDYSGTLAIRLEGIKYYLSEFKKTSFIGFGVVATAEFAYNPVSLGLIDYRFNINDIGIFGMIFQFGFPVVIFIIVVFRKLFIDLTEISATSNAGLKVISTAILFFLTHQIVGIFFSKVFFFAKYSLFWGLILYFIWRFKQPDFSE